MIAPACTTQSMGSCSNETVGDLYRYTCAPVHTADPAGLFSVVLDAIKSKDPFVPCKSTVSQSWKIGISEKPQAGMTGWIIQRVCVTCGVSDCPCESAYTNWWAYDKHNEGKAQFYLEAWFVNGKGNVEKPNDIFFVAARDKKCGTAIITGTMIFVERTVVNRVLRDANVAPPLFKFGYKVKDVSCDGSIKIGPWTADALDLWEKFEAHASFRKHSSAYHMLSREWQCCDCNKKDAYSWSSRFNSSGKEESDYEPKTP